MLSFEGIETLPGHVARFARNPVEAMKTPIRLSLGALISLQAGAAIASSAIHALIERNVLDFAIGIFVFPVISVMVSAIFTLFIYYYFSIFTSTFLEIHRLHSIVVFATVPYFLAHALSGFLAPIDLIGILFMAILLVVGLVEQFGLGRGPVLTLTGAAVAVYFAAWSVAQYLIV